MLLDHRLTIKDVALWRFSLPFVTPPPRMECMTERTGFVVALRDQHDRIHYGEIAPLPSVHAETMTEAGEALRGIVPQLKGVAIELANFDPYAPGLGLLPCDLEITTPPSVRFGLDQLMMSCVCVHGDISLYREHAALVSSWRQPSFALQSATLVKWDHPLPPHLKEDGVVKLKIGLLPVVDECAKISFLLKNMPPRTRLRLDGNRTFSGEALHTFWQLSVEKLIALRIDFIEEPLKDPGGYHHLNPAIPIGLDESLWDRSPVIIPHCQHYVLKPTRLGGIAQTMGWLRTIKAHGAKAILSSCYESGLSILTYARIIHAFELGQTPMGLGSYAYLGADLIEPKLSLRPGHNLIQAPLGDLSLNRSRLVETLFRGWEAADGTP